jgi:flotillin
MLKKAEAYERYGQAAIAQMIIEALPSMAKSVAEPIGNIDKVIVWDGGGDSGGATKMAETVTKTMLSTMESVKEMTGFDLMNVLAGFTAEAKTTKNININKNAEITGAAEGMQIELD